MAYCAMPSKVLFQYMEHRPRGDPSRWRRDLSHDVFLGPVGTFRDLSEVLQLPYTAEVAA